MTNEMQETTLDSFEDVDDGCINYQVCKNVVPGNGEMCADCLDEARHRDAEGGRDVP